MGFCGAVTQTQPHRVTTVGDFNWEFPEGFWAQAVFIVTNFNFSACWTRLLETARCWLVRLKTLCVTTTWRCSACPKTSRTPPASSLMTPTGTCTWIPSSLWGWTCCSTCATPAWPSGCAASPTTSATSPCRRLTVLCCLSTCPGASVSLPGS